MNKKLILPIILGLFLVFSTFSVAAYSYHDAYYNYYRPNSYSYSSYSTTSSYYGTPNYAYTRYSYGSPTYHVDWGPNPSAPHYYSYTSSYGGYYPSYSRYSYSYPRYRSYESSYRTTSYYY